MLHTFDILHSFALKLQKIPIVRYISSFFIAAVEGYIHLLSLIKKAANSGNANHFDCGLGLVTWESKRVLPSSLNRRGNFYSFLFF